MSVLKDALKRVTEKLGKAITDAQKIAAEQAASPEKKTELEESFAKAMTDVTAFKTDCQNIEAQIQAEALHTRLTAAPDNVVSTVTDAGGPTETAKQKAKAAHNDAFGTFLRTAADQNGYTAAMRVLREQHKLNDREINALLSADDTLGGFAVPEDFHAEVLKAEAGFSVVRQAGARVVPTSKPTLTFPTINPGTDPFSSDLQTGTSTSSNWKGEGHTVGGAAPPVQSRPTFGRESIPVHIWQPDVVELTMELLEDTAVPLDSILATLLGETKALDEDREMLIGNGVGAPEGIVNSGATSVDMSDGGSVLTYNGLVDMFVGLPAQYRQNSKWVFNSAFLGLVIKLAGITGTVSDQRPLFQINTTPGNLFARPYLMSEFMPAFANDATVSVLFGDFRHYVIAERKSMVISRLVERFAPNVGILATARVGGQLTVTSAFRLGAGA